MNSQIGISIRNLSPAYILNNGFRRAQICQAVVQSSQLTEVLKAVRDNDIEVGFHLPIYHQSNPRDAFYMSKNFRLRDANFEILEANLRMIRGFKVDYAVIHFISEQTKMEKYDNLDDFMDIARKSLNRLSILAEEYNIDINIEYSSIMTDYSSPVHWVELIANYKRIGLCLDIGELYFRSQERNKDFYSEFKFMLEHVNTIHLYNARNRSDVEKYGYIPINSSQKESDGWIDIERVAEYIKKSKRKIPIILNPNFDYAGEKYFNDGVHWLSDILNN